MAAVIQTQQPLLRASFLQPSVCLNSAKPFTVSFRQRRSKRTVVANAGVVVGYQQLKPLRFVKLVAFSGDTETADTEDTQETQIQDAADGAVTAGDESNVDGVNDEAAAGAVETSASAVVSSLQLYKEALESNDEAKVAEIEAFLKSIEDEKSDLDKKVAALSEELFVEKDRVLRISADFDNFRKRTDRDRLSLVENAQGEVVENLLPVLDNFERAKAQIKVETEGEEKINNSYQSIYKQFIEILNSLGVVPVDTIGNAFDPMLHEAIMRDESTEFDEGVIIDEFRKGFKLGDRLLRPSMVKVSAGPGPAKPEQEGTSEEVVESREEPENGSENSEESVEVETL